MRAKPFCILTTTESRAQIYRLLNAFKPPPPRWFRLLSVLRRDSVVVDMLFNVLPIVCGSSVFVFVLLCITLCPF